MNKPYIIGTDGFWWAMDLSRRHGGPLVLGVPKDEAITLLREIEGAPAADPALTAPPAPEED